MPTKGSEFVHGRGKFGRDGDDVAAVLGDSGRRDSARGPPSSRREFVDGGGCAAARMTGGGSLQGLRCECAVALAFGLAEVPGERGLLQVGRARTASVARETAILSIFGCSRQGSSTLHAIGRPTSRLLGTFVFQAKKRARQEKAGSHSNIQVQCALIGSEKLAEEQFPDMHLEAPI